MTMARINDEGRVVEFGLPSRLKGTSLEVLHRKGWRQVVGTPKPADPDDGQRWVHLAPYTYDESSDTITGTWQKRDLASLALRERRERMVVTPLQAKVAIREAGLREQVENIVADPEADPLVVDAWHEAREFRRMSPAIIALADKLGLTDEQIDALFEQAAGVMA